MPPTPAEIDARARSLLAQMSLAEKVAQMSGDTPFLVGILDMLINGYNTRPIPAGKNTRLGIPAIRFSDGPRGVVMGHSTCFPVSMGRGATWNPALEEQVGDAIGVEVRAGGANFFGGVCINLLRHPAWGRAQETYGEDPFLLGEMGAALVRGVQRHAMACIKHYACNSIENSRMKVDVRVSGRALHEVYLPHFKRGVDAGAAAVMSAYNKVNGEYCGHNAPLLRGILKQAWGFEGFVMSDFVTGIRDAKAAALGGLDVEMPFRYHYRARLEKLVQRGVVPEALLDEAVLRILRTKLRFDGIGDPSRYTPEAICSPAHRGLARRVAVQSMVLLKNEPLDGTPLLPLDPSRKPHIALIGKLARAANIGDHGSSRARPPEVVTPLEGLRSALGREAVLFHDGRNMQAAARLAKSAQAAVIIAGYGFKDEGEQFNGGGDRKFLTLYPHDEALIREVAAAQPRTVVVLIGGSAIITESWRSSVPAIVMAWYPGMEGGHALADLLLGKENFSGHLPCTFPKSESQLPFFQSLTDSIEYGLLHGYRLMDARGGTPAFPFGFGLSYTTFAFRSLKLERTTLSADGTLRARVEVTNTGSRPGAAVVQLYTGWLDSEVERPPRELKAFTRLELAPGERRTLELSVPIESLGYYNEENSSWIVPPGRCRVWVGPSADAAACLTDEFVIR